MFHATGILVLLLICDEAVSHGNKKRMVCEQLDDIFGENPNPVSGGGNTEQGPPGKRGIPGLKGSRGDQGLPGPPGVPDQREIDRLEQDISTLSNMAKGGLEAHNVRMSKLERDCVPRKQLELCDVFHEGKCFVLIMTPSRMNIEEGKTACRNVRGNPANIYSREHFEKIVALLRSRIYHRYTYNHIWTGMTVDINLRKIRLSNGRWAPHTYWHPNRPYTPARESVGINVHSDPYKSNLGMFDEHGSYKLLGILCEI